MQQVEKAQKTNVNQKIESLDPGYQTLCVELVFTLEILPLASIPHEKCLGPHHFLGFLFSSIPACQESKLALLSCGFKSGVYCGELYACLCFLLRIASYQGLAKFPLLLSCFGEANPIHAVLLKCQFNPERSVQSHTCSKDGDHFS